MNSALNRLIAKLGVGVGVVVAALYVALALVNRKDFEYSWLVLTGQTTPFDANWSGVALALQLAGYLIIPAIVAVAVGLMIEDSIARRLLSLDDLRERLDHRIQTLEPHRDTGRPPPNLES